MNNKLEEILVYAYKFQHYNDLLLKQCDSWLPEEEGIKQMEKRIRERIKKNRSKL